jgi:hypothetical protein
MQKVRVYKVGDADRDYGIAYGEWYAYELIKLVNKQLMSEFKATVKTVSADMEYLHFEKKLDPSTVPVQYFDRNGEVETVWCLDHRVYEDVGAKNSCKETK